MSDGRVWFKTKIDNSGAAKDLKDLENKIRKSQETISKMENAKLPLVTQAEALNKKLTEAQKKLENLQTDLSTAKAALATGEDPAAYIQAYVDQPALEAAVEAQKKEVDELTKRWDKVNNKVKSYDSEIEKATADIQRNQEKAAEISEKLNSVTAKTQEAFDHAAESAEKFKTRILRIAASTVLFRAFASVLRNAASYMDTALKTNSEYVNQLAKLKGALLTAFQPLYEVVLPAAIALLKVLTNVVSVIGNVASFWLGKTTEQQSAKNAKALYSQASATETLGEAAEEAKRSLAGFDEINQLQSTQEGASATDALNTDAINPDFSDFDTESYKKKIDELTVYLSGALLALGAILAFSGINIPLGIGLMAVGAIGLATVIKENWGAMDGDVKNAIDKVVAVTSALLLALGLILAFSGANIPLGVGLIIAGAIGLATAVKENWSTMREKLEGAMGAIVVVTGTLLLAVGMVLAFSGANIPLGVGLLVTGATILGSAAALDWLGMSNKTKEVITDITKVTGTLLVAVGMILAFTGVNPALGVGLLAAGAGILGTSIALNWDWVKDPFTNIGDWLKDWASDLFQNMWQSARDWFWSIADEWNAIWGNISSYQTSGIIGDMSYSLSAYEIPALARGAVIPPNREFMAVLGDQTSGTNIEAPLETIKQALAEVMAQYGSGDISINFTGDLAQLARILKPQIDREGRRVGSTLASGGDIL